MQQQESMFALIMPLQAGHLMQIPGEDGMGVRFACKEACRPMSSPMQSDCDNTKKLGRYLKKHAQHLRPEAPEGHGQNAAVWGTDEGVYQLWTDILRQTYDEELGHNTHSYLAFQ